MGQSRHGSTCRRPLGILLKGPGMNSISFSDYFAYIATIIGFSIFAFLFYQTSKGGTENNAIRKEGIPTKAEIINIRSLSGGNSAFLNVEFTVKFSTNTQPEVITKVSSTISSVDTPKFQPGSTLPIKYKKDDPQKIIADIPSPLKK